MLWLRWTWWNVPTTCSPLAPHVCNLFKQPLVLLDHNGCVDAREQRLAAQLHHIQLRCNQCVARRSCRDIGLDHPQPSLMCAATDNSLALWCLRSGPAGTSALPPLDSEAASPPSAATPAAAAPASPESADLRPSLAPLRSLRVQAWARNGCMDTECSSNSWIHEHAMALVH